MQIPVFDGDKRKYQSWKSAFLACIDSAPATGDYKLLQLRQYLSGEALHVIENPEIWNAEEYHIYRRSSSWKEIVSSLADKHEKAQRTRGYAENRVTPSQQIARGCSQYIEKGYTRKGLEQEHSELWKLPYVPIIWPGKYSVGTKLIIYTSTKMDDLSANETIYSRPDQQRYLMLFRVSSEAEMCRIAEQYLRIGSVPAYKPFHSFLWRGSIQYRSPKWKDDRILLLVPSFELARIPRYERKTEAGLEHDRLSSTKTFTVVDHDVLLQDTWTIENGRPAGSSLQANVETCGKFEELDPRRKLPEEIWSANGTDFRNADIELLLTLRLYRYTITISSVSETVTSHENPMIDKHLIGPRGFKIQSATNAIFSLLRNIDYEEMKTSIFVTEGLVIAWPLTFLSTDSPEGVPLALNGVHFTQTLADEIRSNKHGREGAESRNSFVTKDFIYLYRNGNRGSRRKWHHERRNKRLSDVIRIIMGKLATRQWLGSLKWARRISSSYQAAGWTEGLVKLTTKLSFSKRTAGCTN